MTAVTSERSSTLDRRFVELLGEKDWDVRPGVAYAVIEGEEVVHERCYGLANLDSREPITPRTRFPIASLTKMFVAALTLMLEDEGRLALDAPVRDHIPEFPAFEPIVTIRHLLTMTSGIREEFALAQMATGNELTPRSFNETLGLVLAQRTQNFPAGRYTVYCNSGYALLQRIIEGVANVTLGTLLRERIFAPLGLADTGFVPRPRAGRGEAAGYALAAGGAWEIFDIVVELSAAGGIVSTLADLQRWHRNVRKNVLAPLDLFERLAAPVVLEDGVRSGYAYGVQRQRYAGHDTIGHAGGLGPFGCEYVYFTDDDLAVVMLMNQNETNWYERVRELGMTWLDPLVPLPTRPRGGEPLWTADYGDLTLGRAFRLGRIPNALQLDERVFHETAKHDFIKPNAVEFERLRPAWSSDAGVEGANPPETVEYAEGNRRAVLRRASFEPKEDELREYAGTYVSSDLPGAHRIWSEDGRLLLHVGGGFPPAPVLTLLPIHRDLFRALDAQGGKVVDYSLAFVRGEGRIVAVEISATRTMRQRFERISTAASLPKHVGLTRSMEPR